MDPVLIDIPEKISTERLRIIAIKPDDGAEINRAIVESIEQLQLWMPWSHPTPTLENTQIYVRQSAARHALRQELNFGMYLKDSPTFVGCIGFPRLDWKVPRFDIGYWIRTSQSGCGYMTEAVNALAAFAFDNLAAQRVMIETDELNMRSRRVAERAGFLLEGVLRNDERTIGGRLRNTCVYAKISL